MTSMSKAAAAAGLYFCVVLAHAHSDAIHARKPRPVQSEDTSFGRPGDARRIDLTIRIDMSDTMRFEPDRLVVKQGDTVRFLVRNSGKVMHEMVIGTRSELDAHAQLMQKHPGMEHDEPYMAHVGPGKVESIVWQFTKAGEFLFGCLLPGHFAAGMVGTIVVTKGAGQ